MGIQAPAEVKYGLILEAVRQDGNLLNISALCRIAGVSRSGYYAWLDAAPLRQSREETDSTDFALVKQAYEFRGYKKGARSIYMRLLHLDPPVVMNIKKIRRLMRKYGLRCPIRQANPYRQMAKAMKTSHVAKNEINRQFRSYAPRKALLTDITYIFYRGGVCYLSPILDVCTHEVLAYQLSDNLRVDFVLDMVDAMCSKYGAELDNSTIVHSDYAEEKTMPKNLITSCILISRIQFFGIVFRVSQARRLLSLYQRSSTAFRHRQLWEQTCLWLRSSFLRLQKHRILMLWTCSRAPKAAL